MFWKLWVWENDGFESTVRVETANFISPHTRRDKNTYLYSLGFRGLTAYRYIDHLQEILQLQGKRQN